jgi:hypothetical protein
MIRKIQRRQGANYLFIPTEDQRCKSRKVGVKGL